MFLNPDDSLRYLLLHEDWHVADIGAGSGAYATAAAKYLPMGKVYAIDINRDLLPRIKANILAGGYKNIEVVWGDVDRYEGTNLRNESMDAIILANTFFQIEDKDAAIQEIKRILKSGGKLLFIEWLASFGNLGPREEDIVSEITARSLFEKSGFAFKENVPTGDYHYGMIFLKT